MKTYFGKVLQKNIHSIPIKVDGLREPMRFSALYYLQDVSGLQAVDLVELAQELDGTKAGGRDRKNHPKKLDRSGKLASQKAKMRQAISILEISILCCIRKCRRSSFVHKTMGNFTSIAM